MPAMTQPRRHPPAALAAFIAVAMLVFLSGCLGLYASEDVAPASPDDAGSVSEEVPRVPEGRPQPSAQAETNRTEQGLGGRAHHHDYWKGDTRIVLFQGRVGVHPFPVFPSGEKTRPERVAYVQLPSSALVFEGTGRVIVLANLSDAWDSPLPASRILLEYRTAADHGWREPREVTPGVPIEIEVAAQETDMPHSVTSLWAFRFTTTATDLRVLNVTIAAHKADEVEPWPGHPDLYAERDVRVILDADVTTRSSSIDERYVSGDASTWVNPPLIIGYGTGRLEVFLNVTRHTAPYEPTEFYVTYHNATVSAPEAATRLFAFDPDGSPDGRAWNFTIPVHPDAVDGPYQAASRWGLRATAFFGAAAGPFTLNACGICFPYEIEYHLTIRAVRAPLQADAESGRA